MAYPLPKKFFSSQEVEMRYAAVSKIGAGFKVRGMISNFNVSTETEASISQLKIICK